MDFCLSFQTTSTTAILGFSIVLYCLLWISRNLIRKGSKKKGAPEAGGAWPMLGHLHLLGGPQPPHRVLADMADKYGPIFTIKMGVYRALVVSNWETAKECLTTHDKVFANRPKTMASELLTYNFSMFGFSPYGPYWRQIRKIATLELLSTHRLEKLRNVRESEVKTSLKELYEVWVEKKYDSGNKVLVDMKRWFGDVTLNVILRILVGERCSLREGKESNRWKEELTNFFALSGKFVVSDALPYLKWLDIGGDKKSMKKTAKELDIVIQEWLEEHKRKVKGDQEDFMDVMMSILDDPELFPGRDADTVNKATCLALILAAADTSTVTLTWALSLLLNNPDVLKKAQNELDIQIGKERQVRESDLKNLTYLQAILKETMRLYPAGPLALPHESTEDCTVLDYHVPAGTRLFINLWKIHRDPHVWLDPCKFQPERFLTTHKDFDVRGQNFEYMPFSSGRRMCPGVSFGLQVMQLTLASLLHDFEFLTPFDEPVDMKEGIGMTLVKIAPLEILLTPRLSPSLYA
ncbi:cytochrome P450 CYP82D47-like [Pistacia vera]|uniref:cytochrome P450 CYP82D47-like n=1 Tax=Pistacia vera TaxID=55513 RepID=UPI001263B244|nr:cytochrome P450 CYP82D47-like [Pistacia vera]